MAATQTQAEVKSVRKIKVPRLTLEQVEVLEQMFDALYQAERDEHQYLVDYCASTGIDRNDFDWE